MIRQYVKDADLVSKVIPVAKGNFYIESEACRHFDVHGEKRSFWETIDFYLDQQNAQVAANYDQIVVMGYDSALFFPCHYVWLMQQQSIRVTRAVAKENARCRVLVGVPTYKDGGISHHLHAENIRMTLKGVREGLADKNAHLAAFAGVAIFSYDSTNKSEWQTYRNFWLSRNKSNS